MKGSGFQEILQVVYKGVENMLKWKARPNAMRDFRMVDTCLLEEFVNDGKTSVEELEGLLVEARRLPTGHLWVDLLS